MNLFYKTKILFRKFLYVAEYLGPYMSASGLFVNADIVKIKSFHGLERMTVLLFEYREAVSEHDFGVYVLIADKYGCLIALYNGFDLFVRVFSQVVHEKIRPYVRVDIIDLIQEPCYFGNIL